MSQGTEESSEFDTVRNLVRVCQDETYQMIQRFGHANVEGVSKRALQMRLLAIHVCLVIRDGASDIFAQYVAGSRDFNSATKLLDALQSVNVALILKYAEGADEPESEPEGQERGAE